MPFAEDEIGPIEDLVVGHRLVDHAAEAVGAGLGRDRDRSLAALAEQAHDGLGQVVEPQRGRADRVAHREQFREQPLDLGVIAQRDRHEPDPAGVRAGGPGDREDPVGRERPDRQVVVAGPAEPAQVRAPAHDLDEQARPELGVGREDDRRRAGPHRPTRRARPCAPARRRRTPAPARRPRSCPPSPYRTSHERGHVEAALTGQRLEQAVPVRRGADAGARARARALRPRRPRPRRRTAPAARG